MSDMIFIKGVVIHARHGVMEHETEVGQRFVIDLELSADLSESSRTDFCGDWRKKDPSTGPRRAWRASASEPPGNLAPSA